MNESTKSYLANLILHSLDDEKNIGIKNGVMGKVIRLLDTSSSHREEISVIQQIAEILLCRIISSFPTISNVYDFETGLCGVAWGIEYLANQSFIENSPKELLSGFNDKIQSVAASTLTEGELRGLIQYMAAHIYNCHQNRQTPVFSHDFIRYILEASQKHNYNEANLHDLRFLQHTLTMNYLPKYIFNTSFISV